MNTVISPNRQKIDQFLKKQSEDFEHVETFLQNYAVEKKVPHSHAISDLGKWLAKYQINLTAPGNFLYLVKLFFIVKVYKQQPAEFLSK